LKQRLINLFENIIKFNEKEQVKEKVAIVDCLGEFLSILLINKKQITVKRAIVNYVNRSYLTISKIPPDCLIISV